MIIGLPDGFTQRILLPNSYKPLTISVDNANGQLVYEHSIIPHRGVALLDGTNAPDTASGVIITAMSDGAQIVRAQYNDASLPGGMYLVDADTNPILALDKNGNIVFLSHTASLVLDEDNTDILTLYVIEDGVRVAMIQYKIVFHYTTY